MADEPTGNLDSRSAAAIIQLFQRLADLGKTILIVTHDPSITRRTEQTVILSDGEIIDELVARALPLLNHPQMLHITHQAERRTYQPGETILQQGEQVGHFFMVASGEVDVVLKKPDCPEICLARLGAGQFFGEVELLNGGKSIASVRAASSGPVEIALLDRAEFLRLIDSAPAMQAELSGVAQQRLREHQARADEDTPGGRKAPRMKIRRKLLKPRWRKVLADLWEGKTRTLLVVASIAVGAFAIGCIATTYAILGDDLNLSYMAIHPANIEMVTTPVDEPFLRSIERVPGVERVEGRSALTVRASKDGVSWLNLNLLATNDLRAAQINQVRHLRGAILPGEHELLIGYEQMRDTGFRTGDWLQVQLADGTLRSMRVAGEIADMTFAHDPMGRQRGITTEETLTWLGGSWKYNRLLVTVSAHRDDKKAIESVALAIKDKVEKSGETVYRYSVFRSDEYPMAEMAMAIFGILGVLGGLVVLLSGSLIVNTLNALFTQQLRQIGVMKLVGARGDQVLRMYLLLILAYAVLALLIAIPLGSWAGYELSVMMARMMNATLRGFRVVPAAVLIQIAVGIGVPLAAGILPVRNGSKISVRRAISNDSMSDQAPGGKSSAGLERLGVGLLSRPVLLSIRNTFRRKGRLALTLFTLTMAGAVFIAVFNVRVSMEAYMDQLMQHFMADVTLTLDHPYRVERIIQAVKQVAGVEQVEAWAGAAAEILDPQDNLIENLNIVAPPADTQLLKPEMLAGRWIQPGDQRSLAISSGIYTRFPNLQPGDKLRLRVAGGRIEEWTVVGVFSFTNMLGNMMSYADYDYISSLLGTSGQSASYRFITQSHSAESQQAICAAIDRHMRGLNFQVQNVEAGGLIRQQSSVAINVLIAFLLSMALLTAFVGSIGLTGTMGMNVLERTRRDRRDARHRRGGPGDRQIGGDRGGADWIDQLGVRLGALLPDQLRVAADHLVGNGERPDRAGLYAAGCVHVAGGGGDTLGVCERDAGAQRGAIDDPRGAGVRVEADGGQKLITTIKIRIYWVLCYNLAIMPKST